MSEKRTLASVEILDFPCPRCRSENVKFVQALPLTPENTLHNRFVHTCSACHANVCLEYAYPMIAFIVINDCGTRIIRHTIPMFPKGDVP